ncbi:cytochrome c oxidase subunit II [Pontibacillus sp. ALD_SL1]|uniref:cytochrome c oxidase subunit II n=1 Tax=Pontibacillus sp. ALD_SL1 TaxID=2777185 RepID=UPI001A96D310|nr:cytochrome c oxidase subunit II [Pontibacillus sp. ALD_SL1]QST01457.1 cytochrome c oxidase subunit II [Pontibacillus sp. ALD_SL1]
MKGWMGKSRVLFLFGIMLLTLTGCGLPNLTALEPKGEGADVIYDLMMLSVIIMVVVGVIVMALYFFVLIRYRQKEDNQDYIPKQTEGNKFLELLWTVVPILLLIVLAVPTVQKTFMLADTTPAEEDKEDAVTIEVTGKQYWWHYNYNGLEVQASQDLYIPTGERVYLKLAASDVIHSFWVPSISGKMDTNPGTGNVNEMWINAYEEGVYYGKCAELCGPSHSLMSFKVVAVSPEEFDQWVEEMKNVNPDATPESESAQAGKELFNSKGCIACHAIGSSPAAAGPNLTNFGSRVKIAGILDNNKQNLIDWLQHPEDIKPGNKMTGKYGNTDADNPLTSEEAEQLADYLLQLNPTEITPEDAEAQ